jgi:arylsulfatase A-like enzyme
MQHAQAQQNIILLIADDVSPEYFGFYSTTTDTATMPNIRSLAAKGITFSKVWASPVCSPTRAGIFTGRHSFRTGVGAVIGIAPFTQRRLLDASTTRHTNPNSEINFERGMM